MKIGLGAVQFGMDYGISNEVGKTPPAEVAAILDVAARHGIGVIDTAAAYGDSEQALGQCLSAGHRFALVTKTPFFELRDAEADATLLETTFVRSLSRLNQPSVYGLLIHRADDLLRPGGDRLWRRMEALKHRGLVAKIGVSVYSGQQIDRVAESYPIDLVQLPFSVLDQRLLASGHLERLERLGVEVHARSVFLQGLLLMEPAQVPDYFSPVRSHLEAYRKAVADVGVTPLQAALAFAMRTEGVDVALCGVNNRVQLEEIVGAVGAPPLPDAARFAVEDEAFVNPANWRT